MYVISQYEGEKSLCNTHSKFLLDTDSTSEHTRIYLCTVNFGIMYANNVLWQLLRTMLKMSYCTCKYIIWSIDNEGSQAPMLCVILCQQHWSPLLQQLSAFLTRDLILSPSLNDVCAVCAPPGQ